MNKFFKELSDKEVADAVAYLSSLLIYLMEYKNDAPEDGGGIKH